MMDINGDGYVDAHEIRMFYKSADESLVTFMFENFDGDRDGVINFEEMYTRSKMMEEEALKKTTENN